MAQNRGKQKRAEKLKRKRADAQARRRERPVRVSGGSSYDPELAIDETTWLAATDEQRLARVTSYHQSLPPDRRPPNLARHATLHALVETQLAGGDPAEARAALERLQAEGLSRHDALHAIGSVLLRQLQAASSGVPDETAYARELAALSKQSWLDSLS